MYKQAYKLSHCAKNVSEPVDTQCWARSPKKDGEPIRSQFQRDRGSVVLTKQALLATSSGTTWYNKLRKAEPGKLIC